MLLSGTCCSQWMGMMELRDFETSECASIFQTKHVLTTLHFLHILGRKNVFRCVTRSQMKNDEKEPETELASYIFLRMYLDKCQVISRYSPHQNYRLTFKLDASNLQCCGSDCLSTLPNIDMLISYAFIVGLYHLKGLPQSV